MKLASDNLSLLKIFDLMRSQISTYIWSLTVRDVKKGYSDKCTLESIGKGLLAFANFIDGPDA